MKATKQQKQQIHILTKNDKSLKEDLVQFATGDRNKTSTNDLNFDQANQVIEKLGGSAHEYENWAKFDRNKKSHMQILSICRTLRWTKTHPIYGTVVDLQVLSEFIKGKKSPVKKPLLKMDKNEVSKIIVALEGIVETEFKK
ncbi:hypothetical protein EZY14_016395 [Kordia sp. TARA_039_SRF]|nr:hypothetical protein EZY14_016395 [Kordia sp. TARA_039_SRF]